MVKNEEDNIVPTLKPFIASGIKNFLVYDTGSTDNTIPNVKKFFKKYKCRGVVINDPFIDFASSRDKALDAGDEQFKDCKFMLMIDAEWYVHNPGDLLSFCKQYANHTDSVYYIDVTNGASRFDHARLIRINGDAYFVDVVHEYINQINMIHVPSTVYLSYRPKHNSIDRWYRDIGLLLKKYQQSKNAITSNTTPYVWDDKKGRRYNLLLKYDHERPPGLDPRTVFYLGQTYDCLNIKSEAIKYYLERSGMVGYLEEAFMALYRIGKLYESEDWDKAAKYYLLAYEKLPTRIEPLVKLAQHYLNPQIKYMYAKQACSIPKPDHGLFLETDLYEYDRWEQLSIGSWYMGTYREGYDATQKVLKIKQLPHLIRNNELFEGALGIKKNIVNKNDEIDLPNPKILNLILYSEDNNYDQMKDILTEHNKNHNIKYYFYCYKSDMTIPYEIVDDVLYISGKESYIPGILEKTLEAFNIFKNEDYDYIVRSNISTIIDYKELLAHLKLSKFDYGGPLYYVGNFVDLQAGMTKEKNDKYKNHHFVSGVCIIFNKQTVKLLVDNKKDVLSLGLIDDVAIGVYLHDKKLIRKKLGDNMCSFDNSIYKPGYIVYRNKGEDRNTDIANMKNIFSSLKQLPNDELVIKNDEPIPKILNLILYSTNDDKYDQMKNILSDYNKYHNIKSYFYCYKSDMTVPYEIVDNILYISGKETHIPGILEKTLEAFDIFKDENYDYIIRSNISTIINYKELFKNIKIGQLDYGGPLYYYKNSIDLQAGLTKEKNDLYKDHHFVSGICIILSKDAIKLLTDNKKDILSLELIDDVAIGVYLHDKNLKRQSIGNNLYSFFNATYNPGCIVYRNKSNNRDTDIVNMKMIVSNLT
jgi:hypothetical protein